MANETTNGVLRLTAAEARVKIAELNDWRWVVDNDGASLVNPLRADAHHRNGYAVRDAAPRDKFLDLAQVPNWPADIAVAWPLLADFDCWNLGTCNDGRFGLSWRTIHNRWHHAPRGKTTPLAICAAWLSWKLNRAVEIVPDDEADDKGATCRHSANS